MKTKIEISAGGVVYKKTATAIFILILKDPKDKWTFPKGLIEKNEKPLETAYREINEEVGLDKLVYRKNLDSVKYVYTYKNTFVRKTVYYFLFELKGKAKPVPQKEEGIQAVKFVDLKKVEKIIGYKKTNGPILLKIQDFFAKKKA